MILSARTLYCGGVCTTALLAAFLSGCGLAGARDNLSQPPIIRDWRSEAPLGFAAAADRRNLRPGDTLRFRELKLSVLHLEPGGEAVVRIGLAAGARREERQVHEGAAFNWGDYHVAVVAVGGPGELGEGLISLEVAELSSLPPEVSGSAVAGGAALRLRIAHEINHITLHHTGSPEPLRPGDDPVARLRGLQSWGASDRNWWDVPYHLLIDLEGRVYQGRDWRYMGETNTTYDPRGHLLISVLGNYGRQQPTPEQLATIADLMAWAVDRFAVPIERIGGHYDYADTDCPGRYLRQYLEDGTFKRMVAERLAARPPAR